MPTIYSIGHSNRSWEDFVAILKAHGVRTLVDIRRFPYSPKWPHFNGEVMREALAKEGIQYVWMEALGGRRNQQRDDSPNRGLRSPAFRNYADYMMTEPFQKAIAEVIRLAEQSPTTIMCAEAVYFQCHRMLVSDWLVAHRHEVLHLQSATAALRPHKLTDAAQVTNGELSYPSGELF